MTYRKSIRKYCLFCMDGSAREVELCPNKECELYPYRFGKGGKSALTPLKSIRRKCLDCVGFSAKDVKECKIVNCPLFYYRFGHNPRMEGKRGQPKGLLDRVRPLKGISNSNKTPKKGNEGHSQTLN